MYLGKEGGNAEKTLARRVFRDLTAPIEGNNYHLYMDNFYCDPHLFPHLFIAVAQSELEGKDFLKIFLLQKLTKSACPGAITSLESMINLLL